MTIVPSSDPTRDRELQMYKSAHVTLVVTLEEQHELLKQALRRVYVVPNIVPFVPRVNRTREPTVLFIGGFRHAPNVDAVRWFASDVWPQVIAKIPDARWIVAGSNTPPEIQALHGFHGIQIVGFVESTMPLLEAAQVSIAPLTYGAGMKGKVSEALAAGVPLVTTRWGAQGLMEGAGTAFLLADAADEFADAVVLALTDETVRERLSREGPLLARKYCSIESAAPTLDALVAESLSRPRGRFLVARVAALAWLVLRRRLGRR